MKTRIWKLITSKIAELLPDARVSRTYDAVANFNKLQTSGGMECYVTLEAVSRERVDTLRIMEVYEFEIWLVEYLPGTDLMSEMDARIDRMDTLLDAFSLKKWVLSDDEGSVTIRCAEESETLGNTPYNDEFLIDSSLFSAKIEISVRHERQA